MAAWRIRPAVPEDLEPVRRLLRDCRLPVDGVEEHLCQFLVLELDGRPAGCVGLEIHGRQALLRSLCVEPARQGYGYGQHLYEAILDRARQLGVMEIILLTETARRFFAHQGFETIERAEAGPAICASVEFRSACPRSALCMRLRLSSARAGYSL